MPKDLTVSLMINHKILVNKHLPVQTQRNKTNDIQFVQTYK